MKNKHLEVRRRIEDIKLKISDAELFASPLYASVLSDVAKSTTHRYRRSCQVFTYWNDSPDADVACTNNRSIRINAGNRLTRSFPTRILKDQSLRGLLGHEVGHILYTDFNMAALYNSKLRGGEWYPSPPVPEGAEEEDSLEEIQSLLEKSDKSTLLTLHHTANLLDNVLEDVYIEARICQSFPGTYAQGIHLNNLRFAETMPSIAAQTEKESYGFSILANLLIQYCKTGDVNNLTGEKSEYLDVLADCIPIVDEAVYDDDGKARYRATNRLLIHLWPYLKELREHAEELFSGGASEEDAESDLSKALAEQVASLGTVPSGKSKASSMTGEEMDPEELKRQAHKAREVLDREGGRLLLEHTDGISTGEEGGVTVDDTYTGAGYDKAADDIERILKSMAESRVCAEEESSLEDDLQDLADGIDFGDAHEGIPVRVNRMATVPDRLIREYNRISPPLLRISRRLQRQVRQVLRDRSRGGRETGLLMGHRILTRSLYHNDGRIFYKNRLPQDSPQLAVALLVDESGSMCCSDRITIARAASIVVYDFCKSLNIPILVQGHTEQRGVEMFSYADFNSRDGMDCYRLMDLSARADNRDGAALRFVAECLLRRPEEIKLLILISDGQPCARGYYGTAAEADLRGIKRDITRRGVTLFAAAIGDDKEAIERIYGEGFLDISNLNDLPVLLTRLIAQRIRKE